MSTSEYAVRNANPSEFEELGKLMVQVYSQLEGFPKQSEQPDYYKTLSDKGLAKNPLGPKESYDPAEPGQPKKIQRGGSYLCTDQYCTRYMVGTRGKGEWRSATNHLGFRCVKDLPKGTKVIASK